MNWYKQQLIDNFCKRAGVLDDLAGAGEGVVDLVKSLIATGVNVKDILASLVKIFGNTAKIPAHILQPLKEVSCTRENHNLPIGTPPSGHVSGQMTDHAGGTTSYLD